MQEPTDSGKLFQRQQHIYKPFSTIQVNVTANTPKIPDVVKTSTANCRYMRPKVEIFITIYSKMSNRFCLISFHTKFLSGKHRVLFAPSFTRSIPLFRSLHWLPVGFRILFKINFLTYKTLREKQPVYLHSMLTASIPSRSLRSNNDNSLSVPRV